MNSHPARKRFGQHFLIDADVIERIVRHIGPRPEDNLIEIGPGKGAMTAPLAARCRHLQLIEIDRDLVAMLQRQFIGANVKKHAVTIHQADALTVDFSLFAATEPMRIVGNLPYNISTPLIFHLLSFNQYIQDMYFMLQHEVVERLVARPGDKQYGRLSVMAQYYCRADKLFDVSPDCFAPRPKVHSAIVRLTPHKPLPYIANNPDHLGRLVNRAFQQRRKTLHNALKSFTAAKTDTPNSRPLPIDLQLRAENLSVGDYVRLSNFLNSDLAEGERQ